MEQLILNSTFPEAERHAPQLRSSPLWLIVGVMLIGCAVVIMSVTALAQHTPVPLDPFPAYADVFPGQPGSAVEAKAFSCKQDYDHINYPEYVYCMFTPISGVFSRVEAKISNGTIYQLTFTMRDNTIRVGDLAVFLIIPTHQTLDGELYFYLPESFVIVRTADYVSRFSPFLSIRNVSFVKWK